MKDDLYSRAKMLREKLEKILQKQGGAEEELKEAIINIEDIMVKIIKEEK